MKSKILLCIDHLDPGGSQRQVIELASRLPSSKFDITICNLDGGRTGLKKEIEKAHLPLYSLNQHGFFDIKTLIKLYNFIKINNFDIVHTYLFTADTYGRICAILARTPVVLASMRSVDSWKNFLHKITDRILALGTDKIVVNAREIQNFLEKTERITPRKIKVIYNGIDENLFGLTVRSKKIREDLGIKNKELLVGIFARNDPVKDHKTFFHAAKIILESTSNVKFLAMGYGMNNSSMKKIVHDIGIENNVILMDHSPKYLNYLASVDISIISSLIEGCSNVILESMALKKPVVATEVGGNLELVVNGKTGYLIPPKRADKLSSAIINLLDDPPKRERMGYRGFVRAKNKFSMKQMIDNTSLLYKECLIRKKL
ncbi:MAG: glycosyltransferase [Candidatus Celaenobacter antarcticus]|nr:glycosyltransferase [Candidatus Celaenobacter antarcticus]